MSLFWHIMYHRNTVLGDLGLMLLLQWLLYWHKETLNLVKSFGPGQISPPVCIPALKRAILILTRPLYWSIAGQPGVSNCQMRCKVELLSLSFISNNVLLYILFTLYILFLSFVLLVHHPRSSLKKADLYAYSVVLRHGNIVAQLWKCDFKKRRLVSSAFSVSELFLLTLPCLTTPLCSDNSWIAGYKLTCTPAQQNQKFIVFLRIC